MSAPLVTEVRRRTARFLKTRSIREVLNGATGAIDLASILVGVIVLGVVGGIIAASVFAVIPWAQNSAARADLDAVNTAESAVFALGSADGDAKYLTMGGLLNHPSGPMIQDSDRVVIGVGDDDQCYVAISQSQTGARFFITNTNPAVQPYETGVTVPGCLTGGDLTDLEGGLPAGPNPGGSGTGDPGGSGPIVPGAHWVPAAGFDAYVIGHEGQPEIDFSVEPFQTGASCGITPVEDVQVTSLEALVGDTTYTVDIDGWMYASDAPAGPAGTAWVGLYNVVANPTLVEFGSEANYLMFKDSYITYTLDGCADTNYFHLQTPDDANNPIVQQQGYDPGASPETPATAPRDAVWAQSWGAPGTLDSAGVNINFCTDYYGNFPTGFDESLCGTVPAAMKTAWDFIPTVPGTTDAWGTHYEVIDPAGRIFINGALRGAPTEVRIVFEKADGEPVNMEISMPGTGKDWHDTDDLANFIADGDIHFSVGGNSYSWSSSNAREDNSMG